MVFPTVQFAVFFPIVLALSWALMRRQGVWKPFMLAASYVFYAAANPLFCVMIAAVTLGNQACALLIHRSEDARVRKQIVVLAVTLNLATLGVFKYYGFFATEINGLLDRAGLGLPLPLAAIALPVGISFIIFQAISYTVDVYRRLITPAATIDVALYLSFFPHLVAGPIVRAREFIPQLQSPRDPRKVAVGAGVALILIGLVKKVAIADFLAREIVDPVFGVPQAYAAPDVLLASYAYAVQIFCDFSGYTDIAIGLALLLGFVFPQNFDRPYRAASFGEFWRRWHITLSRFLRDFLYIPLGGNRGGKWKTIRNLMITMVLGGLWHGAAWGFVLWGAIHGTALVVEHQFRGRVRLPRWLGWLLVFHIVVLAWIPFRAPDLGLAGAYLARFADWGPATLWTAPVVIVTFLVIALQVAPAKPMDALRVRFERLHPVALGASMATVILLVAATVSSQGVPPFIYFSF
ncbi:MAG: Probable poly(beta-D-mannuronate) O-acetylase [uncultured Solirubrobacteraceae bacterium]|uniref:Probable poly(Beta-D-mannuronate) O-acetylase n=1 Tax=uncultured Solirubrobacteraceae bacterium TaxID=1162706 RepID=A0A6J4SHQ3_9ACTN|nr:MAG: Probable poly(beta-D-mannuronate) O-acetylase [uncultured Solirubrobacteraceae bacterium]